MALKDSRVSKQQQPKAPKWDSFKQRRKGVMKKANDLNRLTGARIAVYVEYKGDTFSYHSDAKIASDIKSFKTSPEAQWGPDHFDTVADRARTGQVQFRLPASSVPVFASITHDRSPSPASPFSSASSTCTAWSEKEAVGQFPQPSPTLFDISYASESTGSRRSYGEEDRYLLAGDFFS